MASVPLPTRQKLLSTSDCVISPVERRFPAVRLILFDAIKFSDPKFEISGGQAKGIGMKDQGPGFDTSV